MNIDKMMMAVKDRQFDIGNPVKVTWASGEIGGVSVLGIVTGLGWDPVGGNLTYAVIDEKTKIHYKDLPFWQVDERKE